MKNTENESIALSQLNTQTYILAILSKNVYL